MCDDNKWRAADFGVCCVCEFETKVDQNSCCESCDSDALEDYFAEGSNAGSTL